MNASRFLLATALLFVGLAAAGIFRARRPRREDAASSTRTGRGPGRVGGGDDPRPAAFRVPGYQATPALFLVFLVAVIAAIALARPLQVLAGFALVLLGVQAFALVEGRGAPRAAPEEGEP